MKRSELRRGKPLDRSGRMVRKPVKRSQPRRDWTEANHKREEGCRYLEGCDGPIELAHVIGRKHDGSLAGLFVKLPVLVKVWVVAPARVVPLCRRHHTMYDAHELDLLPCLSVEEQAQAVVDADGIEQARIRTAPLAYRGGTA